MSKIVLSLLGFFAFLVGAWLFTSASPSATSTDTPKAPADEAPAPPCDAPLALDSDLPDVAAGPQIAPNLSNPPEANPRLTRPNFDKIHNWMTEEQVKSILGDPTSANIRTDPARGPIKVLQWSQRTPATTIEVEFIEGLSIAKNTTLPAPAAKTAPQSPKALAFGISPQLSRENYDRVENGMTEEEIIALLGRPYARRHSTLTGAPTITLYWRQYEPYITVTISLRNGNIVSRNWATSAPFKKFTMPPRH